MIEDEIGAQFVEIGAQIQKKWKIKDDNDGDFIVLMRNRRRNENGGRRRSLRFSVIVRESLCLALIPY